MKKNVLALSIAAMIGGVGFMGAASAGTAVYATDIDGGATPAAVPTSPAAGAPDFNVADNLAIAAEGVGHILVVPYFSTQDGNASLLNIVNTDTSYGKAVKVRYRGAANSDDVYDITVLLSPGDVWSANVSQEDGVSKLVTNDKTCTLPADVNAAFSGERVQNGDAAQTLEGYIEILNMADIPPTLANADGSLSATANPLFKAIKHVKGVAPCADIPSQLADLTNDPNPNPNNWYTRGYNFPSGGLMANWSIVNLSKAGSFTGAATAIAARQGTDVSRAVANLVFSPQDASFQPANAAAVTAGGTAQFTSSPHPVFLTADPLLAGGIDKAGNLVQPRIQASLYDFPDLSTPYVTDPTVQGAALEQAETLSKALATVSVTNEFFTSPVVGFATDWTFSMPARRYNVARDYTGAADKEVVYAAVLDFEDNVGGGGVPLIPAVATDNTAPVEFGTYFTAGNTQLSTDKSKICVKPKGLTYFDTEEQGAAGGSYVISPQPIGAALAFCGETSVLTFNNATGSVLGAKIATQNIVPKKNSTDVYTDGWMTVQTPNSADQGLPVLGHAFVKALGSSANLGGIWAHRTDRTGL